MHQVDPERPWRGGRWIVRTETGQRFPLTLAMLLFDSSGTNKDAALQEHREALRSVMTAAKAADADPLAVACALDWLLYDWLMAHRDGPDSARSRSRRVGRPTPDLLAVDDGTFLACVLSLTAPVAWSSPRRPGTSSG